MQSSVCRSPPSSSVESEVSELLLPEDPSELSVEGPEVDCGWLARELLELKGLGVDGCGPLLLS